MHGATARLSTVWLVGILSSVAWAASLEDLPVYALENRRRAIDAELARLASYSPESGIGAIGYRSQPHDTEDHPEWVEIELGKPATLDQVVLVPAIRRDAESGFQADGFPKAFRLVAGTSEDRMGKVVAQYTTADEILPRIAPLIIRSNGMLASWIRIEAQTLSRRDFDKKYVLQLSEVLAFSGLENVALHKPVKSSSCAVTPGWAESYLVDGFMPYLMVAPQGSRSVAYVNPSELGNNPVLAIDLGTSLPLTGIHLHAVDQSDTVPQAFAGDFGIPQLLRIEGANEPGFSDAKVLIEFHHDTIYDVGPIMMWTLPQTTCRFVRLKVLKPNINPLYGQIPERLGFAEIELFSGGRNVALHRPVTANFEDDHPTRRLSNLTDGLNFYGTILPVRDWLNQLARRHKLEREQPRVVAELNQRYARQRTILTRLAWLSGLLAAAVVILVLIGRLARQRAIERTRQRIAADLHDELGADLHAIGLLSDLAQAARAAPEKLDDLLQRIRSLTERTGQAARHCTNMLEAEGLYGDIVDDMRRTADRILADLQHDTEVEGEALLHKLPPRKRVDLRLFYQECLMNIIRHSGATRAHTRLSATKGEIRLTVSDNGHGLDGKVPSSLKRRARLLGAAVEAGPSDSNGARIDLRLKTSRFGIPR